MPQPSSAPLAKIASPISEKALRFAQREKVRKKRFLERRQYAFRQRFYRQLQAFPWWFISSLIHFLALFFWTHFLLIEPSPPELYIFKISWEPTTVTLTAKEKPALTPEPVKSSPIPEPKESLPVVPLETKALVSETPVTLPPKVIAVPEKKEEMLQETPPYQRPTAFQNRFEGKTFALKEYGGGKNTESAVENGLDWLARHQSKNGSWNPSQYTQHCLGKKCDDRTTHANHTTGLTGLALLCFLGAGELPIQGRYSKKVSQAIQFLLTQQKLNGAFGPGTPDTYNQAIATIALIEAYSMTGDTSCKDAGQRAILYLSKIQQAGGGWDYYDIPSQRNDTSITGWVIMAFHSARYAHLEIPDATLKRAKSFLHCMYNQHGSFLYNNLEDQTGAGMTGVGALCLLYLEEKPTSLLMQQCLRTLKKYPPHWQKLTQTRQLSVEHPDIYNYTLYAWYYATLCFFHVGGEAWSDWNEKLKVALLPTQQNKDCKKGSWDPVEAFFASTFGGRIYATTLNLLSLEVYYRYLPLYRSLSTKSPAKNLSKEKK